MILSRGGVVHYLLYLIQFVKYLQGVKKEDILDERCNLWINEKPNTIVDEIEKQGKNKIKIEDIFFY